MYFWVFLLKSWRPAVCGVQKRLPKEEKWVSNLHVQFMFGGAVFILGVPPLHPLQRFVPGTEVLSWPGRLLVIFGLKGSSQSLTHRNKMVTLGRGKDLLYLEVTVWAWPGTTRIWWVLVHLWLQGTIPFLIQLGLQISSLQWNPFSSLVLFDFFLNQVRNYMA